MDEDYLEEHFGELLIESLQQVLRHVRGEMLEGETVRVVSYDEYGNRTVQRVGKDGPVDERAADPFAPDEPPVVTWDGPIIAP